MKFGLSFLLALLILVGNTLTFAQEESEIVKVFDEAITQYQSGKSDQAAEGLKKVVEMGISPELAYQLREKAGYLVFMEMLTEGGDTREAARAFLSVSEKETADREVNPDKIKEIVERALVGGEESRKATIELSRIGEVAVPHILEHLKDSAKANNARSALVWMNSGATLPLLASLKSKETAIQENVIVALGEIGDRRAIPELKWLAEKGSGQARSLASAALGKIYSPLPVASAKEEFVRRAYEYYIAPPGVIRRPGSKWYVWRWKNDQLEAQEVPGFLYHYKIAEESCYDSLRDDPNYKEAWSLLVRIYFSEYTEAQASVRVAEINQATPAEIEYYKNIHASLETARVLATAAGIDNMMLALEQAIRDGDGDGGAMCLDALAGVCTEKDLGPSNPIFKALTSPDKRLKYAAAMALVKINPSKSFQNSNLVVPVLVDALGESDARTVLVVDNDPDVRNHFLSTLNNKNYAAFGAVDGLEALEKAKTFPTEDLIILDSSLSGTYTAEYVYNNLKSDFRTRNVPIIVTSDAKNWKTDQKLFAGDNTVIDKGITEASFLSIVAETLNEEKRRDYKTESRWIAQRAAESLASIDPTRTVFDLKVAAKGLSEVLRVRPDVIRAPAIRALGNIGDPSALPALVNVFRDPFANENVRATAAWSIGEIFKKSRNVDRATYLALQEGLSDWDDTVKINTGLAVGKASLQGKDRVIVLNQERHKPDRVKPVVDTKPKQPDGSETKPEKKEGDDLEDLDNLDEDKEDKEDFEDF